MEDDDMRGMLRTAVMKDVEHHRDIVGAAVEIVRQRRRRLRMYGATASGVAVAMGATALVWVGGATVKPQPEPGSPSATTTSSSAHAETSKWDKEHDILYRLPGLLNPLLPHGLSLTRSQSTNPPNGTFWLNGPSGSNDFDLSAEPKDQRNKAMEEGCVVGGVCSHRQVPGGTLYIATKNFTADYAGNSGYAPGTGKQVLSFSDEYEFVPSAADGTVVDLTTSATVSQEHYAKTAPSDSMGDWPPDPVSGGSFDASGALVSADDFAALIAKSGFGAVATLLDSSSPVAASTLSRHKAADAAIAAAVKPVLPPGLTLAIGTDGQNPLGGDDLTLTGPTGANMFSWTTEPKPKNWRPSQACGSHTETNCTSKDVPGGEIEITHASLTGAKNGQPELLAPGQADTPTSGGDVYRYLPDDPNGTVIAVATGEQLRDIPWVATRPTSDTNVDPSRPWPPPARTGEPFNPGGSLLTVDQFAALAQTPGIADIIRTVNAALDPLGGVTLQTWG